MQRGGGKCCWTRVKCLGAGVGVCTEDRRGGKEAGGAGRVVGKRFVPHQSCVEKRISPMSVTSRKQ